MVGFTQSGYNDPVQFFNDRLTTDIEGAMERDRQQKEAEQKRKTDEEKEQALTARRKQRFIEAVGLEKSSPYSYAEWLMLWMYQGGSIRYFYGYDLPSYVQTPTIHNLHQLIPDMYGANSFKLLLDDRVARVNMTRTRRDDLRLGWEWGHSEVQRIITRDDGTYEAYTNHPDRVIAYADVVALIRNGGVSSLQPSAKSLEI